MQQRDSGIKIRHMKRSDIKQVAEIERECFSLPWSESAFEEELALSSAIIFAAVFEKKIIGFVSARIVLDEVYINNIAVTADFRKKGVGRLLLSDLEEYVRPMAAFITLEVRASNKAAKKLYEASGYKAVGIRKNFYEKPIEDAILMTKTMQKINDEG
jgi:ribosomal-protein-alanine N-acetyltransferase